MKIVRATQIFRLTRTGARGPSGASDGGGEGADVVGPASAVDDRIATFDGVTGKLLQDGGKVIAELEPVIVYPTESPETKYYRGDGTFHEIAIGSSGFAANLYLSSLDSTIQVGYKRLSYLLEVAEVVRNVVVNANTVLSETLLFEQEIDVTTIPSGTWRATFFAKTTEKKESSWLQVTVFKRTSAGAETDLFTMTTGDLVDAVADYARIVVESSQLSFAVLATDRLGARVHCIGEKASDTTINYIVGDGRGAYLNTPLSIRHDQLRDKDGEDAFQHFTLEQKTALLALIA